MTLRRLLIAAAVLAVALGLADGLYVVRQDQQAAVSRFGTVMASVNAGPRPTQAGLHVKWPLVDRVWRMSRTERLVQLGPTEMTGADGRRLSLDADLAYQIGDPAAVQRRWGGEQAADEGLRLLLAAELRQAMSRIPASRAISDGTAAVAAPALAGLREEVAHDAPGVRIVDVQLLDAAPASSDVEASARRLQDLEMAQAAQLRAEGDAHRRELMAIADRDAADTRAESERQALEIRGQGDAQRSAVLAQAYGADPDFARFFRRLEAYDMALDPQTTTLVLGPDNAFMRLFQTGPAPARP